MFLRTLTAPQGATYDRGMKKGRPDAANPSLTGAEADLLARHLLFYRSLDEGTRAPTTDAQRRFVEVARGAIPPLTVHENAYLRFKGLNGFEQPRLGAGGGTRTAEAASSEVGGCRLIGPASATEALGYDPKCDEPPKYYDRDYTPEEADATNGPSESWYSREDYKQYYSRYP